MDCTGLYLAELDFALLYWSSLDGEGGGGKRKHSVGVRTVRERGEGNGYRDFSHTIVNEP